MNPAGIDPLSPRIYPRNPSILSWGYSLVSAEGFGESTLVLEAALRRNDVHAIARESEHVLRPFDPVIPETISKGGTRTITKLPGNVGRRENEMPAQIASTQGGVGEITFQICIHPVHHLAPRRITPLKQFADRGQYFVFGKRFGEDIPRTCLHCSDGFREAVDLRQKDDVGVYGLLLNGSQNFQTVEILQSGVQDGDIEGCVTEGP